MTFSSNLNLTSPQTQRQMKSPVEIQREFSAVLVYLTIQIHYITCGYLWQHKQCPVAKWCFIYVILKRCPMP